MITQLWGLSKRTLSKKGNLAVPQYLEPSKFLAEFRSSAKKGTLRFPNIWNLLNSLRNLEVAQKREPCGSLFCLLVLDCSTLAHGVIQDFFTDSERLGSYLQKLVCVDEVQCLLQA